ncbi:hypothetical protein BB560_002803 [Smittium megazygosporum]|uniref:ERCC4 domain-containing protein n=1 Tax=Smittium megazygosporum TaxID=133381 RepID=A0A2T9ZDP9_9FUNG|nr:hypothetical protein BB560_002803 [Smittium megazygosporum]
MLPLLPFQQKILDKLLIEDALCVVARGLGLDRILTEFLRLCSTKNALVLLLNCTNEQELALQEALLELSSGEQTDYPQLKLVKAELTPANREKNNEGFIKAISDKPEGFVKDFAGVESSLKTLFLRSLHLWPRFQLDIKQDLSADISVIEIRQPMSQKMIESQQAILDCMIATVNEIKKLNKFVEYEDFEYSISTEFERKIRHELAPYWHRISSKSKQLISDLSTLRFLIQMLMDYDCVSFNTYLDSILNANVNMKQSVFSTTQESEWILTDSGNLVFNLARQRVFKPNTNVANPETENLLASLNLPFNISLVLEEQPKWEALSDIIDDIINQSKLKNKKSGKTKNTSEKPKILIMVNSEYTMHQISSYLSQKNRKIMFPVTYGSPSSKQKTKTSPISIGFYPFMINLLRNYFLFKKSVGLLKKSHSEQSSEDSNTIPTSNNSTKPFQSSKAPGTFVNKRRRVRGASLAASNPRSILLKTIDTVLELEDQSQNIANSVLVGSEQFDNASSESFSDLNATKETQVEYPAITFDENYGLIQPDKAVTIKVYSDSGDDNLLDSINPTHVILFNPDTSFIRRLEVHIAHNPNKNMEAYFMVYDNSIEEQKYLNAIRQEKEAFEKLIHTNSVMVIPIQPVFNKDLESEYRNNLLRKIAPLNFLGDQSLGFKDGDALLSDSKLRIIVDVREFRSALPFALYKSKPKSLSSGNYVEIVPRTLLIGDYILHDECCVERKSIPDFVQSLSSGRLYSQCQSMTNHYKHPLLLIEFESNLSFSFSNIRDFTSDFFLSDSISKLILLVLTFPKVRILWSTSPEMSSSYFLDLKSNHPEPDAERAVKMGTENTSLKSESQYNISALNLLQAFPGVDQHNVFKLMDRVKNISHLCTLSKKEIAKIIGTLNGELLYNFLHAHL